MRIALATLASSDYFPGAKRLFESIKINNDTRNLDCILLSDSKEAQREIGDLFNKVVFTEKLPINPSIFRSVPRFQFTFNKLYIFKFFAESDYDRVIFFDSDLLCSSNLSYLFNPKLNRYDLIAAQDHACWKYYGDEIIKFKLNPRSIFNTGCFILNRSILQKINFESLVNEISINIQSYDGGDQGYLNYVVHNQDIVLGKLPLRFNYPLDENYPLSLRPPALFHFSGAKPWKMDSRIPSWDKKIYLYWGVPVETLHCSIKLFPKLTQIPLIFWNLRNLSLIWNTRLKKCLSRLKNSLINVNRS